MIEAIKEALEKASSGDWGWSKTTTTCSLGDCTNISLWRIGNEDDTELTESDYQFAAKSKIHIRYLLDELEKANKELEKVTLERDLENWKATWYEGHIEDASRSADYWQQYYRELLEEYKAMKEALEKAYKKVEAQENKYQTMFREILPVAQQRDKYYAELEVMRTEHTAMKEALKRAEWCVKNGDYTMTEHYIETALGDLKCTD